MFVMVADVTWYKQTDWTNPFDFGAGSALEKLRRCVAWLDSIS